MRPLLRLLVLIALGTSLSAQDATIPVPANVKAEGLPAIPAALAARLRPYGEFRRAQLFGWHGTRREMLVLTTTATSQQVHLVDAPLALPKPLTSFADGAPGAASFSPVGGEWIVVRKDTGAAETHQLLRVENGTTTLLTDGTSRNGVPAWSRKSGRIAFDSNRRNGRDRDIYVVDPKDASSSRMLAEVSGSWEALAWSPDETALLALELLPGNDTALWSINVATGKTTALTLDSTPAIWSDPQFSPDGKSIYAISNRGSELPRAWRWRAGKWTVLTRDGDSVEAIAIAPDGKTLAVSFDRDASSRLELIDTTTLRPRVKAALPAGQIALPPVTPRGIRTLQWAPGGGEVGFSFGSARTSADVFSVNAASGAVTRWTKSSVGGVDPGTLPEPEIVRWMSFDGRAISGVMYRPPARFPGPRPVMINIHGGPNDARERPRFQGRSAYFLNEMGIAILYPNVRGTFAFGKTFEKLDDGRMREDAVKDIGSLLDWIGRQKDLDPTRVMVTGASYGGYMTYAAARRYPDRIRCAFAAAAISDFVAYLEGTEPGRQQDRRAEYGDEREPGMRAFLAGISPVTHAATIKVPLMIAHGRKDARVPVAQAESMHQAARGKGVPVWLVIYEDAGHENFPGSAANANYNFYTWITFVETFLLN
ncbi:MAG TPA: alpha/beta fold hydrolase [Vicinamibacterales bacterium]|nr:alpha/beta fold hydrolase [Vicinamibacterales bacterium]